MGAFRSGIEVEKLFAKICGFKSFRHSTKVHDPSTYEYCFSFVETPRKFVVAKSNRIKSCAIINLRETAYCIRHANVQRTYHICVANYIIP